MPKIIETEVFIEPRDAFQVVGTEAYGPNWQASWIDDPQASERKLVLGYLRAALKSGHVAAHWSTLDFRNDGDLSPQEADREFFSIRLNENTVFHHSMNEPVHCRIHKEQLRGFIRGQGHRTVPATQFDANQCFEWLVEQFSDPEFQPPRVADHIILAKELFPRLSNEGYKQARKHAIQVTDRDDLAKGGRRAKSNQSAN